MAGEGSTVVGGPQQARSSGGEPAPKGVRFAAAYIDMVVMAVILGVTAGILLAIIGLVVEIPISVRTGFMVAMNIAWLIFRDTIFSPGRRHAWRKVLSIVYLFVTLVAVVLSLMSGQPVGVLLAVVAVLSSVGAVLILIFDKAGPSANLKLISEGSNTMLWLGIVVGISIIVGTIVVLRGLVQPLIVTCISLVALLALIGLIRTITGKGSAVSAILQAAVRNVLLFIPVVLIAGYVIEICFILFTGNRVSDRVTKMRVVTA
jgi:hypothetical protein